MATPGKIPESSGEGDGHSREDPGIFRARLGYDRAVIANHNADGIPLSFHNQVGCCRGRPGSSREDYGINGIHRHVPGKIPESSGECWGKIEVKCKLPGNVPDSSGQLPGSLLCLGPNVELHIAA